MADGWDWGGFEAQYGAQSAEGQGPVRPAGMPAYEAPRNWFQKIGDKFADDEFAQAYNMADAGLMRLATAFRPPSDKIQVLPSPYSGPTIQQNITPGRANLIALMQMIASQGGRR